MNTIPPHVPGYCDTEENGLVDPCRTDNYYNQPQLEEDE